MILIGIDPGVKTGMAVWDTHGQEFHVVRTVGIVGALQMCGTWHREHGPAMAIWFEDARLRKWFGNAGREKLQGAGSIKRDSSIWQEFCEYHRIRFKAIKPMAGATKWDAKTFKKVTGHQGRTSEHSRDAALIVFGEK